MPTDAVVVSGTTYIDESMITGEPLPVLRTVGDEVVGGTINQNGMVIVRTRKVSVHATQSLSYLFR